MSHSSISNFNLRRPGKNDLTIPFKLTCIIYPPSKNAHNVERPTMHYGNIGSQRLDKEVQADEDDYADDERESSSIRDFCDNNAILILARPIFSPYSTKRASLSSTSSPNNDDWTFSTRHDASCRFTSVDQQVATLLGYMPQEMEGASLFKFTHPDDLSFLLGTHRTIVGWLSFHYAFTILLNSI